ncbi:MAG: fumarylacetoacetase [Vicingaceae bacterium]
MNSWLNVDQNSDFSIYNIPFGIASINGTRKVVTRLGDTVIDLHELQEAGYFSNLELKAGIFHKAVLNDFIECGKIVCTQTRAVLIQLLSDSNSILAKNQEVQKKAFHPVSQVEMRLPVNIGDYTDFYSSIEHATNVGKMFRDPENALLPNWKHLPVGYHGRSSSIVISGTNTRRPMGQTRPNNDEPPVFGPSKLLDFELEMAFITYSGKALGERINTFEADDYIFGMCLFNDWSARDIQKWEYVPLGPFLAKNFASSISPWIVTLEALEAFRVKGPIQDPPVLPYLQYQGDKNIDIQLEVYIQPENSIESKVSASNYKYMYWNMEQQLAHHTVNGCNIRAGDMMASGTISGQTEDSFGSMLELSWSGSRSIKLADGSERKFLQDGDTVIMKGFAQKGEIRVGFGEVRSKILPARID